MRDALILRTSSRRIADFLSWLSQAAELAVSLVPVFPTPALAP
jgi:hypothetical protein